MTSKRRLRWAIFTTSVVSAVDNPDAYLWRALGAQLRRIGHEALFFEPRGNEALRALLQQSGSAALKAFHAQYPEIEYRTLESRLGADLVEWMSRTLATADVAVVQSSASPDLITWLAQLTRPHLRTFYVDTGWSGAASIDHQANGRLSEFTAILIGDNRLVEQYAPLAPSNRILSFGPLPRIKPLEERDADSMARLANACTRLIDAVTTAQANDPVAGGAQFGPNGHRS